MAEVEIKQENLVYAKPRLITDNVMHYCPGCSHGTVHKLVAEVIDEMGLAEKAVGISPVGCSVFAYNYIDIDWIEAAHGRALAVATAVKRLHPGNLVFTYQGDGDLSAIGTAESIHAAARGENVVAIYINNAIYGMTGGQMAPTTLLGMKTATTPLRPRPAAERLSLQDRRDDGSSGRCDLHHASERAHARQRAQVQEGDPQGVRKFDGRQRFFRSWRSFQPATAAGNSRPWPRTSGLPRTCCPSIRWAISRT